MLNNMRGTTLSISQDWQWFFRRYPTSLSNGAATAPPCLSVTPMGSSWLLGSDGLREYQGCYFILGHTWLLVELQVRWKAPPSSNTYLQERNIHSILRGGGAFLSPGTGFIFSICTALLICAYLAVLCPWASGNYHGWRAHSVPTVHLSLAILLLEKGTNPSSI